MKYEFAKSKGYGEGLAVTVKGEFFPGMLYQNVRIDRDSLPQGLHAYGVRSKPDKWEPGTIMDKYPKKDFFGTFVTTRNIPVDGETSVENHEYFMVSSSEI